MHLGVKPRLRVSGPRPRPSASPPPRSTEPQRPSLLAGLPPGPLYPAGLFRIRGKEEAGGGGMVLRDGERPETSPLMAPAPPPAPLTRWGPAEGNGLFPTSEACPRDCRHPRVRSPAFGDASYPLAPLCPPSEAALIKSISYEP